MLLERLSLFYQCDKCQQVLTTFADGLLHLRTAHTRTIGTQYEEPKGLLGSKLPTKRPREASVDKSETKVPRLGTSEKVNGSEGSEASEPRQESIPGDLTNELNGELAFEQDDADAFATIDSPDGSQNGRSTGDLNDLLNSKPVSNGSFGRGLRSGYGELSMVEQKPFLNGDHRMYRSLVNKPAVKGECSVCGDDARGLNYGVLTCGSCKTFFGCISQKCEIGDPKLICTSGSYCCEITRATRARCTHCRFQKCLDVGMTYRGKTGQRGGGGVPWNHAAPTQVVAKKPLSTSPQSGTSQYPRNLVHDGFEYTLFEVHNSRLRYRCSLYPSNKCMARLSCAQTGDDIRLSDQGHNHTPSSS